MWILVFFLLCAPVWWLLVFYQPVEVIYSVPVVDFPTQTWFIVVAVDDIICELVWCEEQIWQNGKKTIHYATLVKLNGWIGDVSSMKIEMWHRYAYYGYKWYWDVITNLRYFPYKIMLFLRELKVNLNAPKSRLMLHEYLIPRKNRQVMSSSIMFYPNVPC